MLMYFYHLIFQCTTHKFLSSIELYETLTNYEKLSEYTGDKNNVINLI